MRLIVLLLLACLPAAAQVTVGPTGISLPPTLRALSYEARDDAGLVFRTGAARLDGPRRIVFQLTGPAANQASVSADYQPLPGGARLDFTLRYSGAKRAFNGWVSGFHLDFATPPTGAKAPPAQVIWRQPTGAQPWEVPGDTLYPDTECQVRQMLFGDRGLALISPHYDPDWFYERNLGRLALVRCNLPSESPAEARYSMTLLPTGADGGDPARLAALAMGRPLMLRLSGAEGRPGNLYLPGETATLRADLANVSGQNQRATLTLDGWSYQGQHLLSRELPIELAAGGERRIEEKLALVARGVVFVTARLAGDGGTRYERLTFGALPERTDTALRPGSPFAMAAAIGAPQRYADQPPLDEVIGLAQRIGARWLRMGVPLLDATPNPGQVADVAERAALLARHGLLGYAHPSTGLPEADGVEAFSAKVASTVKSLRWGNDYLELGNELNFAHSAEDYVNRMLRPQMAAIRRERPELKVLTMGLGGVTKSWIDAFDKAGGMDLVDVLSIHPGCHPRAPEFYEGWSGWVFRPQMRDAMAVAKAHGKPIWLDEVYAPTPPSRQQVDLRTSADYLVRLHVCALALGVERIAWYQLQDGVWFALRPNPEDMEYSYGLVYCDGTPKPAFVAYGAMTEQLEGARCLGRLDLGADDLYGFRFATADGPLDVLWSYREKHETDLGWYPPEKFKNDSRRPGEPWVERWQKPVTVTLPAAGAVTVTDTMGNRLPRTAAGGQVTLSLRGSPRYVRGLGTIKTLAKVWPEMP